MERCFTVEAKCFSFSTKAGEPELRLEERRKAFGGFIVLGVQGSAWLMATVEKALKDPGLDFVKYFREDTKALMVRGSGNKAGRFLEVVAYAEGGRKGAIWLPQGRGGWGWSRVVGELRKLLSFLGLKDRSPGGGMSSSEGNTKGGESEALDLRGVTDGSPTGIKKGKGTGSPSFAEVVRSGDTASVLGCRSPVWKSGWCDLEKKPLQVGCNAMEKVATGPLGKDRHAVERLSCRGCVCCSACVSGAADVEGDSSLQRDSVSGVLRQIVKILGRLSKVLRWACGSSHRLGLKSSVRPKSRLGFVAGRMLKRCKPAFKGSRFRAGAKVPKPFERAADSGRRGLVQLSSPPEASKSAAISVERPLAACPVVQRSLSPEALAPAPSVEWPSAADLADPVQSLSAPFSFPASSGRVSFSPTLPVLAAPVSPVQGSFSVPTEKVSQSPGSLKGSNLAVSSEAPPFWSAVPTPAGMLARSVSSGSSCSSELPVLDAAASLSGASKLGVKIRSSPPLLHIKPFQHYIRRARELRVGHSVKWNDGLLSDSMEASKLSANLAVNKVLTAEPPVIKVVKSPVKQGMLRKGFLNPRPINSGPSALPREVTDVGVVGDSSSPSGCSIPLTVEENGLSQSKNWPVGYDHIGEIVGWEEENVFWDGLPLDWALDEDFALAGDFGEEAMAIRDAMEEEFQRDKMIARQKSKGKRELLNLHSSINYGDDFIPARRRKGKAHVK